MKNICPRFRLRLFFIAAMLVLCREMLPAQPAAPIRRMYNVGDNEFYLGAVIATHPATNQIDSLWSFIRSLNLNMMTLSVRYGGDTNITPLVTSSLRVADSTSPAWNRLSLYLDPITDAAHSNAVDFFPFDSVQSQEYQCRFTGRAGGRYLLNPIDSLQERLYSTADSTTVGQMIAWNIAYDHHPQQVYRYTWSSTGSFNHSVTPPRDSIQHANAWIDDRRNTDPITYLAVAGHLVPTLNGSVANDSAILKIEIWHEVPKGEKYVTDTLASPTAATSNLERLYTTLYVTKGDLKPLDSDATADAYNKYRQRIFKIDLRREGNTPGPLFTDGLSHRFDIRVYWLGGEKVALRSIGLRDYTASLLYGDDSAATAYKASIIRNARFALTGDTVAPGVMRNPIIMIESGFESQTFEDGGAAIVSRLLRDTFTLARTSPLPRDTVGIYNFGVGRRYQQRTDVPMVMVENLQDKFFDTVEPSGTKASHGC